jgi:hypothetical protein
MYKIAIGISIIIFFITFFVSFFAIWKSNKNKKLFDIKPITAILQIEALFDIMAYFIEISKNAHSNEIQNQGFLCSLVYPSYVILANKITSSNKNKVYFTTLGVVFLFLLVFTIFVDYTILKKIKPYFIFVCIILYLAAIITAIYRSLHFKHKLVAKNYFYYLLVGFLISDLFYFLCQYRIIDFEMSVWMPFFYFYMIFLDIIRVIYIGYVIKSL